MRMRMMMGTTTMKTTTLMLMMVMMLMTNLARSNIVDPSNTELIFNSLLQARDFLVVIIY